MNNNVCQHIGLAVELCGSSNNSIKEVSKGWTHATKVFYLAEPLTAELKQRIQKEIPTLEYWKEVEDPHYAPMEGFFCNECKEGMIFPIKK